MEKVVLKGMCTRQKMVMMMTKLQYQPLCLGESLYLKFKVMPAKKKKNKQLFRIPFLNIIDSKKM